MKKKVLIGVAVVVLLPVLSLGIGLFMTMRGLAPMPPDGKDLAAGDARLVSDGFTLSYLLPFSGGVALVDCGNDEKGAAILAELKKRSLGPDDVKACS